MKNRAKCRLCNDIIESYHATDYVECKCGEIGVSEGDSMRCCAKSWGNFMRVDDKGNEIAVKVKEDVFKVTSEKPNKKQLVDMLDEMIKSYDRLPENAMSAPVSNYDLVSSLMLLLAILRSE